MKNIFFAAAWLIAVFAAPQSHAQDTSKMTADTQFVVMAQALVNQHFAIWGDPSSDRIAKFAAVYTSDITVADYAAVATGYSDVNQVIGRVQKQHEGFKFSPEPVTWNHGFGRVRWGFGPQDNPNLVRGEDIFTVRDGKLSSLHVFLDNK